MAQSQLVPGGEKAFHAYVHCPNLVQRSTISQNNGGFRVGFTRSEARSECDRVATGLDHVVIQKLRLDDYQECECFTEGLERTAEHAS